MSSALGPAKSSLWWLVKVWERHHLEVVEGVLLGACVLFHVFSSHSLAPKRFNGLLHRITAHLKAQRHRNQ